jgi:hypothetical protein
VNTTDEFRAMVGLDGATSRREDDG